MRNKHKLQLEQLDQRLDPLLKAGNINIPDQGWIKTIRTALNMTMEQLGNRLNITRQGVNRIEESEANGTLTLNSLKDVANALEMKFVYAIFPDGRSIDEFIDIKSEKLARKIVLRTNQNMMLENQGIGEEKIEQSIEEIAREIKREMRKSLWD